MKVDYDAISDIDWARLAAFIDGEGCILIGKTSVKGKYRRDYLYLDLRIANTDPRLTMWLQDTFGGKVYVAKRARSNWSPAYHWTTSCRQAYEVLKRCLPYFIIKHEQASVGITFQETLKRWGVKGAPPEVRNQQYILRSTLSQLKGTSSRRKANADPEWVN